MVHASQMIEKNALSDPPDVHAVLDDAQARFFQISQTAQNNSGITIKEIISGAKAESRMPYLKELQERQQRFQERGPNEPAITGIPSHFIDLDKMINGFSPSNLYILASRPAMGKTALALNICEQICFRNRIPVGIFSLEMSAAQLVHRTICSQSEVESEKIQTGSLNGSEYQRVVAAINEMQKHTMVIDDQPGLKITDLRARARRMKETHNIGFLAIDYLQLISGSGAMRSIGKPADRNFRDFAHAEKSGPRAQYPRFLLRPALSTGRRTAGPSPDDERFKRIGKYRAGRGCRNVFAEKGILRSL